MKKILISIILIILLVLTIILTIKGISLGKISLLSYKDVKQTSAALDSKIQEASTATMQNYPKSIEDLKEAEKTFKTKKEQYNTKIAALGEDFKLGITQIETYKIEFLWTQIGLYASDEYVKLDIEFKELETKGVYDLNFTVNGEYIAITNFIYDIENDDDLNFKIEDFKMSPTVTTKVTKKTSGEEEKQNTVNTKALSATFVVKNIPINFN